MVVPFDQSVVCPVLVGRAPVLAALERLLERACAGQGRIALLTGEAGIGKSRLVAEMKARARHRGMTTSSRAIASSPTASSPTLPLLDLLRALLASELAEDLARALGPAPAISSRALPELAALAASGWPRAAPTRRRRAARSGDSSRHWHSSSSASREPRPLLLVVEDLHWSDDTSLDFLLYLARRVAGRPILLLLTYRDEEPHAGLTHFLADLDRERLATELRLARLPLADVEAMLRAIFAGQGARARRPASRPLHADRGQSVLHRGDAEGAAGGGRPDPCRRHLGSTGRQGRGASRAACRTRCSAAPST